jgi:hypothetical protein
MKQVVALGFPGDTTEEKMRNCRSPCWIARRRVPIAGLPAGRRPRARTKPPALPTVVLRWRAEGDLAIPRRPETGRSGRRSWPNPSRFSNARG